MIPISVCVITKNEAENLKKCLEALTPYPFEIVVTDTGSEDDSVEVAKQYTNRVYTFEWVNDFSSARLIGTPCRHLLWSIQKALAPLSYTTISM